MAENKGELNSFLMKVKEESGKVVLKLNIHKGEGSSCKTPDLDAVGKVGWGAKSSFQRYHLKVELIGFATGDWERKEDQDAPRSLSWINE